jgi:hypothetical protein
MIPHGWMDDYPRLALESRVSYLLTRFMRARGKILRAGPYARANRALNAFETISVSFLFTLLPIIIYSSFPPLSHSNLIPPLFHS